MGNNAPDYEDNLVFPPQEESIEQKLEHYEKMRDLQAEYACKLEEKLRIAERDIKWIEEQADTKHQDDYDPEIILKKYCFNLQ